MVGYTPPLHISMVRVARHRMSFDFLPPNGTTCQQQSDQEPRQKERTMSFELFQWNGVVFREWMAARDFLLVGDNKSAAESRRTDNTTHRRLNLGNGIFIRSYRSEQLIVILA